MSHVQRRSVFPFLYLALCLSLVTESKAQTSPAEGIRKNTPSVHALTNARIVQAPGKVIEKGTLVVRQGVIQAVGSNAEIPKDARIWDMKGLTIYPGLIDSYSDYGLPKPSPASPGQPESQPQRIPDPRGASYWNRGVLASQDAAELFLPDAKTAEKLRSQGITSALIVPIRGIFKGTSALVNVGDAKPNELIVRTKIAQHILLGVPQGGDDYPGSLMGAIALIRQALFDADWYQKAQEAYAKNPSLARPETNVELAALKDVSNKSTPVVIDAGDELDILRAQKIAQEFSLNLIIRGNGNEYKRLDAVKGTQRPVILPLNFPEAPAVQSPEDALQFSLEQLRHWDEAPENPKRLQEAGVQFAFTSAMLKDPGTFLAQVRKAVDRGLSADAALAALTTTPARLFGIDKQLGSLEPGKLANFIVTDGDLFTEKTVIRESWIDGRQYDVKPVPDNDPRGKWWLTFAGRSPADTLSLHIKGEVGALEGTLRKGKEVKFTTVTFAASRLSISFAGDSIGYNGVVRITAIVNQTAMNGSGEWPDGKAFTWTATRRMPHVAEPDTAKKKAPVAASFPSVFPPGEYGRPHSPDQPSAVLVKGATLWTCAAQGRIENADLLIQKGKIVKVGKNLDAPSGATIIDGTGKHVTPGIIDAHSHTAGYGGLNEAGQAISAEARVGDVIDCDDIDIYRELAGGTTVVHILHGSANPIGGQSQLIKLRWGSLPEEMKFEGAPPTIKFALGENVKQSNWGDNYTSRYPQTRMGVEQIMRDEFTAALDYEKTWQRWEKDKAGIPPRRDLELDAIVEILRGKRYVHCHSYRQDEILAMMRVAEDFGFRIKVFQHILEGYKVADVMAKHGAGGSSFSDWWAYKIEVYDAIPYNGVLMHDQGVLVSFNSDSDELARRLNLEAAKALKYGGLSEEEALRFVTINPAKQLLVDNRVGSLEPGKDADFVVWSGNPLSTYTICEQTWLDGRKYFDRQEDRQLQDQVQRERTALIQKALTAKKESGAGVTPSKPPKKGDDVDHPRSSFIGGEGH